MLSCRTGGDHPLLRMLWVGNARLVVWGPRARTVKASDELQHLQRHWTPACQHSSIGIFEEAYAPCLCDVEFQSAACLRRTLYDTLLPILCDNLRSLPAHAACDVQRTSSRRVPVYRAAVWFCLTTGRCRASKSGDRSKGDHPLLRMNCVRSSTGVRIQIPVCLGVCTTVSHACRQYAGPQVCQAREKAE